MIVEYLSCLWNSYRSHVSLIQDRIYKRVWMHDHRKQWGQRLARAGNASWDTVVSCCRDVGREGWERTEGKRSGESGWSGDFVRRHTKVRIRCKTNKEQATFLDPNCNRMSCHNLAGPSFWGFWTDFPLVQWCIHIPASAHKWPVWCFMSGEKPDNAGPPQRACEPFWPRSVLNKEPREANRHTHSHTRSENNSLSYLCTTDPQLGLYFTHMLNI